MFSSHSDSQQCDIQRRRECRGPTIHVHFRTRIHCQAQSQCQIEIDIRLAIIREAYGRKESNVVEIALLFLFGRDKIAVREPVIPGRPPYLIVVHLPSERKPIGKIVLIFSKQMPRIAIVAGMRRGMPHRGLEHEIAPSDTQFVRCCHSVLLSKCTERRQDAQATYP